MIMPPRNETRDQGHAGAPRFRPAWWIAAGLGLAAVLGLLRDGLPRAAMPHEARAGASVAVAANALVPALY